MKRDTIYTQESSAYVGTYIHTYVYACTEWQQYLTYIHLSLEAVIAGNQINMWWREHHHVTRHVDQ